MPPALTGFAVLVALATGLHAWIDRDAWRWPWSAAAAVAWLVLGVSHALSPEASLWAVADGWLAGILTAQAVRRWRSDRASKVPPCVS